MKFSPTQTHPSILVKHTQLSLSDTIICPSQRYTHLSHSRTHPSVLFFLMSHSFFFFLTWKHALTSDILSPIKGTPQSHNDSLPYILNIYTSLFLLLHAIRFFLGDCLFLQACYFSNLPFISTCHLFIS